MTEKRSVSAPGFRALLLTQSLSAFNDNAFKTVTALLMVASLPPGRSAQFIAAAGAVFILPFLLLSTAAGSVADRFSKKKIIVACKCVELALMLLTLLALPNGNIPGLLAILFCLGAHSAFIGPAKLAILPEVLDDADLSRGNGLMQMMTFLGIVLGTVAAGLLISEFPGRLQVACLVFAAAAAAGLGAALRVTSVPAAGSAIPIRLNFVAQTWDNLSRIRLRRPIFLALLGSAYFWFLGAIFQMNILVYGQELMHLSQRALSGFQIAVALGIGLGSYVAGRLSREKVELGLVPLGALGLVLFPADLAFAAASPVRAALDLFLAGVSGGVFVVPLDAFIQQRTPKPERGRTIATENVLSLLGVLAASGWLYLSSNYFKLYPNQIFLVVAVMTVAVAAYILSVLPDFFLRLLLYPLVNLVYRIEVEGRGRVPLEGPALLVSNHVSFVDAFLIEGASPRLVRFMMLRRFYGLPVLNWFFRAMGVIPISDHDSPKALLQSFEAARQALREGDLVCIFAEGEISRHGQMLRFKKGVEHIAEGLSMPIIPVHLDRVWGSIFSFEGGRILLKWPRRLPYPVTVSFGAPLPPDAKAEDIRQAVRELGADAFQKRLAEKQTLPRTFAREAKRRWFGLAMADVLYGRLSCGAALVRAFLLGRVLDRVLPPGPNVGLLLPPSVPAALANLGLSLRGRIPVNLNYTLPRETALRCAERAGAKGLVTSRRFLDKLGWEPHESMVFLEDLAPRIKPLRAALTTAAFFVLPPALIELFFLRKAPRLLSDTATVIFTSGSTGEPKGVVLSHANIQANIEAIAQVYQMRGSDRLLGVLPFFHSFGYTVTLWMPAAAGLAAVYHPNPLDAKGVGELIARYGVTIVLGTPTFLTLYLRRIEPAQMKSVNIVMAGAEKLRAELVAAFEEKFGITPLEGFGCTELSPVACVNIPDVEIDGVRQRGTKIGTIGQPLPGVAVKVVDPESLEPLPAGQAGLLLVKGPNVMVGYLGDLEQTEKVLKEGYYSTGDIGCVDADGFVTITDRLSRFSKIGGEMVPHLHVEQRLHSLAGRLEQTFIVTAVPDAKKGERLVVLYKDYDDIDGLWRKLNDSDAPKLWVPERSCFHKVTEFPLLGSGKLDLAALKKTARELEDRKAAA
ncbi:MAG: acyl-[ACP]--phospholipid O-acyltransferase [Elusimicrobia bacterium]|nr:acyl-[ACP]--phospholipid O-acyltransferase [Elusimicrobiota bacterium]